MKAFKHHGIEYYKSGKYYYLLEDYAISIGLHPRARIDIGKYASLTPNGVLTVRKGYRWDGPSGPTIDTENFMRGSLVHDVLYQALRLGVFIGQFWGNGKLWGHSRLRLFADQWIRFICRQDGMSRFRAAYVYRALRIFGAKHAKRKNK